MAEFYQAFKEPMLLKLCHKGKKYFQIYLIKTVLFQFQNNIKTKHQRIYQFTLNINAKCLDSSQILDWLKRNGFCFVEICHKITNIFFFLKVLKWRTWTSKLTTSMNFYTVKTRQSENVEMHTRYQIFNADLISNF